MRISALLQDKAEKDSLWYVVDVVLCVVAHPLC